MNFPNSFKSLAGLSGHNELFRAFRMTGLFPLKRRKRKKEVEMGDGKD
jgi:hypothetical protein